MMASHTITQNCLYWKSCKYADSTECIDNYCGCLRSQINKEEAENPKKSRHKFKTLTIMKKYSKPQVLAKNLPTGSYAAGCPSKDRGPAYQVSGCIPCERTK